MEKPKRKAVFLDRDGTVVKHKDYIVSPKQIELEQNAVEGIKLLNQNSYLTILVTNQPQVAMNLCTMEQIKEINDRMQSLLIEQGTKVDDIFFCPHHPDKGGCECRKPKTGLLLQAAAKHHIDLSQSWMVGDASRDVLAGKNAGTHTICVDTGLGGRDEKYKAKPDFQCADLLEAARRILEQSGEADHA